MLDVDADGVRQRRSLRGNVDRNPEELFRFQDSERRSLRGNVDRNDQIRSYFLRVLESFPTWERG